MKVVFKGKGANAGLLKNRHDQRLPCCLGFRGPRGLPFRAAVCRIFLGPDLSDALRLPHATWWPHRAAATALLWALRTYGRLAAWWPTAPAIRWLHSAALRAAVERLGGHHPLRAPPPPDGIPPIHRPPCAAEATSTRSAGGCAASGGGADGAWSKSQTLSSSSTLAGGGCPLLGHGAAALQQR